MTDDQFTVLVGLLTDIRNGIALLCTPAEEPEAPPASDCEHPENKRTDFSGPGETHWVCECGFEYRSSRRAVADV